MSRPLALLAWITVAISHWTKAADQLRIKVDGVRSKQAVLRVITNESAGWASYTIRVANEPQRTSRDFHRYAAKGLITRIVLLDLQPDTWYRVDVLARKTSDRAEKWTQPVRFKTHGTRPEIRDFAPRVNVVVGSRFSVSCNATGHPPPNVIWYKRLYEVEIEVARGRLLSVNNASLATAGTYKCVATNGNKPDAEKSVLIYVAEPPVIDVKPDNQEVRSGDSFDLECAAKGRPAPSIKWYKDGEFLQTGASLRIESSSTGDEGTYRCEATNSVLNMTDWASANVSIIREPQNMAVSATIAQFDTIGCNLGQEITLQCHGESPHAVTYQWTKNDRVIAQEREVEITLVDESAFGTYRCQTTNKAGPSTTEVRIIQQDRVGESSDAVVSIPRTHFWAYVGCGAVVLLSLLVSIAVLIRKKDPPLYETPVDGDARAQGPRGRCFTLGDRPARTSTPHAYATTTTQNAPPTTNAPEPSKNGMYASLLPPRDYMNRDGPAGENTPQYENVPTSPQASDEYEVPRRLFSFGRRKVPRYPR